MGKTILYIAMTLDGFIAGENDDLSFLEHSVGSPESNHGKIRSFESFFDTIGALIVGRNTYDWEKTHAGGDVHPIPKFVLTHQPQATDGKTEFTNEALPVILAKAKAAAGDKDVWIEGGARVAQQYLEAGLIDILDLYVFPYILGKGVRLFEEMPSPVKLELIETNSSNGMVQLKYNVL